MIRRLAARRRSHQADVSVVMATYNGERHLAEQLHSIADQTLLPTELVVRDDGSKDGTTRIVRAFARTAPFDVRLLDAGERLGYAQNFAAAAASSSGRWLVFADQDDLWRRTRLESITAAVDAASAVAVFHDFALWSAEPGRAAPSYRLLLAERELPVEVSFKGCSMAVTRQFAESWGWPPAGSTISHDFWVGFWSLAAGQQLRIGEVLLDHRLHSANASGWIAGPGDRVRSTSDWSALEVVVDLVIKQWRVVEWTAVLLTELDQAVERGAIEPAAAQATRAVLHANSRFYSDSEG